jgi:carboxypeptidase Taq
MNNYLALEQSFARRAALQDALGILHWDAETVMPSGASASRAESAAILRGIAHNMMTDASVQGLLDRVAEEIPSLDPWQRANLREMRRLVRREVSVPRELVEADSKAVAEARTVWREARAKNDFGILRAPLERVVALKRAVGEAKGQAFELSAYDALLDDFDPGLRTEQVEPVFAELRATLPVLVNAAIERQSRRPLAERPKGPFAPDARRKLARDLLQTIGFDFTRGHLGSSVQAFCGGASDDVRIAEAANEDDFLAGLMTLLHECGHALYEQGRPRRFLHQPVGRARGLTVHESQALLMELQVCSSREFLGYLAPMAHAAFGGVGTTWKADNLFGLLNTIKPSLIRTDADEITYVLHAIIRYELEKAIIADDLRVADLPSCYNDAVRDSLGLVVPNDAVGCLQDVHWSAGLWGYFPTYALGAILAAQLFDAACRACPDIPTMLGRGDFSSLRDWLGFNVYAKGSFLETDEMILAASGSPLHPAPYVEYLRRRYVDSD